MQVQTVSQPARDPFACLVAQLEGEPAPQVQNCGEVTHRHYLFENVDWVDELRQDD